MTDMREKAKLISHQINYGDHEMSVEVAIETFVYEALSLAYKQGALARIEGPSDEELEAKAEQYAHVTFEGIRNGKRIYSAERVDDLELRKVKMHAYKCGCRDNLKITPLTADEFKSIEDEIVILIDDAYGMNLDHEDADCGDPGCTTFRQSFRDFVAAKLEGK